MVEKLIIKDEIYGNIELEGIYKEIVESEDFQRLKDIIQTGTSYLEFKEMKEETRYEHSIGSYHLMCKVIDTIEQKLSKHGIKLREEEKEIAKVAMLLHDIGHGAYSHTLEIITGYSHEERGIDIIEDNETKIHKILNKHSEDFANKVSECLKNVYKHKDGEAQNIEIKKGHINLLQLLTSLISNNIDVDRLDFIVRDSKKAGYRALTDVDEIIESFEIVLDVDKVVIAFPIEKKLFLDMALQERARNYRDIYYCTASVIADNIFEILLEELRENKEEVPDDIDDVIKRFLTNRKADFTNNEYMTILDKTIEDALKKISKFTKIEKIQKLCDMEYIVQSYKSLNTERDAKYIKYLLHKAIPELSKDTNSVIEEIRSIKPYKLTATENINVITSTGIEDYKDINQELISLEKFDKRVIAISEEMIRLELGVSKEEYDLKYQRTVQEVINNVTKSKDEFELKYVLTDKKINGEEIKNKISERYKIIDSARYLSQDMYYDNPEDYELLENKQTLRLRKGETYHNSEQTYQFKDTRITYKKCKKDVESDYTIRRKEENIGNSTNLEDYKEFLMQNGIEEYKMDKVLVVDNVRQLYTIEVNGFPIDISFNMANYKNQINEISGEVGIIEIKPREEKMCDRLSMFGLKEYIEEAFPYLSEYISNSNAYEIGILDTYEKYRKGYMHSDKADDYEKNNPKAITKLREISDKLRTKKDFVWLNNIKPYKVTTERNKDEEEIEK